jgi:hypothetical protein
LLATVLRKQIAARQPLAASPIRQPPTLSASRQPAAAVKIDTMCINRELLFASEQ